MSSTIHSQPHWSSADVSPKSQPHPDAYRLTPLLANNSNDSSTSEGSTESDASLAELVTPRGSVSAGDTVQVVLPSDQSPINSYQPNSKDVSQARESKEQTVRKKSSRVIRPKTSFNSWRSSFSTSSISLRLRPSQDGLPESTTPTSETEHEGVPVPGQFEDAHSPSPPPSRTGSTSSYPRPPLNPTLSAPMITTQSGSSDGGDSQNRGTGSKKKLISSLRRLGVTLRPSSFDRRGQLRIPSSGMMTPHNNPSLMDAPTELRVSYALNSGGRTSQGGAIPPVSFAAFLPPDRVRYHERTGTGMGSVRGRRSRSSTIMGLESKDEGEKAVKIGNEGRDGLFSPGQPNSSAISGIEGALNSSLYPPRTSAHTPSDPSANPTSISKSEPPVPTQVTQPEPSSSNFSVTHPSPDLHNRVYSPIEASIAREVGLPLPRSNSSRSIHSSFPSSPSSRSVHSLHRLSIGNNTQNTSPVPSRSGTPSPTPPTSAFRQIPNLTCTPIHPIARHGGLPSAQSAQSISQSASGVSGLRRHSSLRNPDHPINRGSPTSTGCGSPSQTFSPAYTIIRKSSPIPPSLIHTPKALEPPAHPISPVIGACPIEPDPIPGPTAAGRPRAISGRWRSPTGLFELGGLGLGDLSNRRDSISSLRRNEGDKRGQEKYEHVDTPGEFGLGGGEVDNEGKEGGERDNPYFQ